MQQPDDGVSGVIRPVHQTRTEMEVHLLMHFFSASYPAGLTARRSFLF